MPWKACRNSRRDRNPVPSGALSGQSGCHHRVQILRHPIPGELISAIAERRVILFAGAGLSMSVGLPSWQQFIEHLAEQLGLDAATLSDPGTSYHALAEYYRIREGSIGPLRSWLDRNWKVSADKVRRSKIHELIVALDFPIIYTTNYDRNIEAAFEAYDHDYVKVANARDIAKTRDGVTQIVKFHGDFDDDDSLVITETDYLNRLAFDAPLDVKFRSDALGKTVLFVGYSMSDLNIRLLLHNIWRTWQRSGYEKDRPKSFAFMARRNPLQEAILREWGIEVLAGETEDPAQALEGFLDRLRSAVQMGQQEPATAREGAETAPERNGGELGLSSGNSGSPALDLLGRHKARRPNPMADNLQRARNKGQSVSPNSKGNAPQHRGGDGRKAQKWGGGNKAAKGPITRGDRRNENSSAKS